MSSNSVVPQQHHSARTADPTLSHGGKALPQGSKLHPPVVPKNRHCSCDLKSEHTVLNKL
eukprot:6220456-Amphidinium_carterae.1